MRDRWIHRIAKLAACLLVSGAVAYGQTAPPGSMGLGLSKVEGDPQGPMIVVQVVPGSPAEIAGLQPGDRVISVAGIPLNGASVESASASLAQLRASAPNGAVLELWVQKRFTTGVSKIYVDTRTQNSGGVVASAGPPADSASPASNDAAQAQGSFADTLNNMYSGNVATLSGVAQQQAQAGSVNPQTTAGDSPQNNPAPARTKKQKFMSFVDGMAAVAAAASGTSVAGDWVSYPITIRSVDGMYISPLTFQAQLHLDGNGTYTCQVQQSEGMAWTMMVQGTYSVSPMGGSAVELDLMPGASNAGQIPGEALTVLSYAGFPTSDARSFTFTMDAKGAAVQPFPRPRSSTQVYFRRAF